MFESFLELVVNAVDTAATVVVLLALWEGRVRGPIGRWLGMGAAGRGRDVDHFLHEVRRFAPRQAGHGAYSALPRP